MPSASTRRTLPRDEVEDLARKVQVGLIRIEVHCGSAHFQRVLAGDDGTGKHGEPTGAFARSVLLAGFDNGAVFIGKVAGCRSRDVCRVGWDRQGTGGSRRGSRQPRQRRRARSMGHAWTLSFHGQVTPTTLPGIHIPVLYSSLESRRSLTPPHGASLVRVRPPLPPPAAPTPRRHQALPPHA